jgi:hypothetical protein
MKEVDKIPFGAINPKGEPHHRRLAALEIGRHLIQRSDKDSSYLMVADLTPKELAILYNNVEQLGLDLNTHAYVESERIVEYDNELDGNL